METLTVKELMTKEIDIDVCDDFDERIYIAFCGPIDLTEAGYKMFGDVLETKVEIYPYFAVLCVNDDIIKLNKLSKLFSSMAGYCSVNEYNEWFKEV